jgi:hypothetical protein
MYPDQRLTAAAQLLTAARNREGRTAPPAGGLVTAFQADVTARCAVDNGVMVQNAADAVYAGAGHAEYSG